MIATFPPLRTQVDLSTSASWICEVVQRLTPKSRKARKNLIYCIEALTALSSAKGMGMIRLAFAVRFLAIAGFGLENREAWMDFGPMSIRRGPKGFWKRRSSNLGEKNGDILGLPRWNI